MQGSAILNRDPAEFSEEWGDVADTASTAQHEAALNHLVPATVTRSQSDESRWGWDAFSLDGPECLHVTVSNGQARVYSVRVGVAWPN